MTSESREEQVRQIIEDFDRRPLGQLTRAANVGAIDRSNAVQAAARNLLDKAAAARRVGDDAKLQRLVRRVRNLPADPLDPDVNGAYWSRLRVFVELTDFLEEVVEDDDDELTWLGCVEQVWAGSDERGRDILAQELSAISLEAGLRLTNPAVARRVAELAGDHDPNALMEVPADDQEEHIIECLQLCDQLAASFDEAEKLIVQRYEQEAES